MTRNFLPVLGNERREFIGNVKESPAYPGARMSFLIEDHCENRKWVTQLIKITAMELPEPRPKKAKPKKKR